MHVNDRQHDLTGRQVKVHLAGHPKSAYLQCQLLPWPTTKSHCLHHHPCPPRLRSVIPVWPVSPTTTSPSAYPLLLISTPRSLIMQVKKKTDYVAKVYGRAIKLHGKYDSNTHTSEKKIYGSSGSEKRNVPRGVISFDTYLGRESIPSLGVRARQKKKTRSELSLKHARRGPVRSFLGPAFGAGNRTRNICRIRDNMPTRQSRSRCTEAVGRRIRRLPNR